LSNLHQATAITTFRGKILLLSGVSQTANEITVKDKHKLML